MNARFAELCRQRPLDLPEAEFEIARVHQEDGRSQKQICLTCDKDIYIGVFFDGTNNNKYRDTPAFSQSNVARLYEVYPGTPASQAPPPLKPRVRPDGSTVERRPFPDEIFTPPSVSAADFQYYRKIYVPGLGTPMPDVGDSGASWLKTGGLAFALLGQVRLAWAQMQLVNQIHAAVFRSPLESSIDMMRIWRGSLDKVRRLNPVFDLLLEGSRAAPQSISEKLRDLEATVASVNPVAFEAALDDLQRRLALALKQRGTNKPHLRKIRLSIFGFSRGAAAARAWANLVTNRWGASVSGIPLQIDFLGLFDSVASVGFTPAMPRMPGMSPFEGHATWAGPTYMPVLASVRRCAHLVAAFEVRGSFPLDSVCQGEALPPNCKEIVYPGVHSDVGGGYPPGDQGRALGAGAEGDSLKISQVPLAQMYREARMGGVPLAPPSDMLVRQRKSFEIAPQLRDDFNAYVLATRSGSLPPTGGKGDPTFARMYPTETQPREELFRIVRRHYGVMLRWRKTFLREADEAPDAPDRSSGGIAGLAGLQQASSDSRYQDIEDCRGAEEELVKELRFLRETKRDKFIALDDPLAVGSALRNWPPLGNVASWVYLDAFPEVMQQKQREWDTWVQHEWTDRRPDALPAAAKTLFERYVHDSRAWFKPMFRSDTLKLAPDDESWFVFGERDKERTDRRVTLERKARLGVGDEQARARAELAVLEQEGQPLVHGGREPYQMWGYLRHRAIYHCGKFTDSTVATRQSLIESEEAARVLEKSREDRIAAEEARHKQEVDKLRAREREVIRENRLDAAAQQQFKRGTEAQIETENRQHLERLAAIRRQTSP